MRISLKLFPLTLQRLLTSKTSTNEWNAQRGLKDFQIIALSNRAGREVADHVRSAQGQSGPAAGPSWRASEPFSRDLLCTSFSLWAGVESSWVTFKKSKKWDGRTVERLWWLECFWHFRLAGEKDTGHVIGGPASNVNSNNPKICPVETFQSKTGFQSEPQNSTVVKLGRFFFLRNRNWRLSIFSRALPKSDSEVIGHPVDYVEVQLISRTRPRPRVQWPHRLPCSCPFSILSTLVRLSPDLALRVRGWWWAPCTSHSTPCVFDISIEFGNHSQTRNWPGFSRLQNNTVHSKLVSSSHSKPIHKIERKLSLRFPDSGAARR